jgi:PrgI family protein
VTSPDPGPAPVPVPADIDRDDKVVAGLTARQAAILAAAVLVMWLAWLATRRLVPPAAFAGAAIPALAAAVGLALGRRDCLSLDQWLTAAVRQALAPRRLVPAPGGIPPVPAWAGPAAIAAAGPLPAPLHLPATAISPAGAISLAGEGTVLLAAASTVSFALRTGEEQEALAAAYGRWLNSLNGPAQILIRACRVDLGQLASRIRETAPGLPHPALEQAALSHAAYLEALGDSHDLLARQVIIAVRDSDESRAASRIAGAARALPAAGVALTPLDGPAAAAVLAACSMPGRQPPPAGLAPAGQPVTARLAPQRGAS